MFFFREMLFLVINILLMKTMYIIPFFFSITHLVETLQYASVVGVFICFEGGVVGVETRLISRQCIC